FKISTIYSIWIDVTATWMSPPKLRYKDVSSVSKRIFVSFDPSKENEYGHNAILIRLEICSCTDHHFL
ncbi:MAG: hypothetical protein L0G60_14080, partial [Acinetobacter sp.]|nr:hypothetical protein [Acinetobacter sp.]